MRHALLLALVLPALPAAAQEATDDCTFLQQSFAGVYDGLRQMAGGDVERADPATVTMFTAIQTNIILMAQGADCDMGPMIEVAREQLDRYGPQE
jgi:hypothetical protein